MTNKKTPYFTRRTDWDVIIQGAGKQTMKDFVEGKVSVHNFRRTSSEAQRLFRRFNLECARKCARAALRKRDLI